MKKIFVFAALCCSCFAQETLIFQDGFEAGLNTNIWDWSIANWGGTKQIVTQSSHTGNQALYMAGSDHSPGGCSHMRPAQIFSMASGMLSFYYRDITFVGDDGYVNVDLYNDSDQFVGMFREAVSIRDVSWAWAGTSSWTSSHTQLRSASGWNELSVLYNHGGGGTRIELQLNNQNILTVTSARDFGNLGRFAIGAGGQAWVGSWVVDDVVLSAVPEPSTVTLVAFGSMAILFRIGRRKRFE